MAAGFRESDAAHRNRLYIANLAKRKSMEREARRKSGADALLEERERNFQVMFSGANNGPRAGHLPHNHEAKLAADRRPVWVRVPGALPIERRPDDDRDQGGQSVGSITQIRVGSVAHYY